VVVGTSVLRKGETDGYTIRSITHSLGNDVLREPIVTYMAGKIREEVAGYMGFLGEIVVVKK